MKNKFLLLALLAALVLVMQACGQPEAESTEEEETMESTEEVIPGVKIDTFGNTTNSLFIYPNLVFQDIMIADFNTDKYDVEEYGGFLQADIDNYNKTHNFKMQVIKKDADGNEIEPPVRYRHPIEIRKLEAKDNILNQQLLYATAEDFLEYNSETLQERGGSTLKVGKFLTDILELPASYTDPNGETVSAYGLIRDKNGDTIPGAEDSYYVICDFDAVLYSSGDVLGVIGGTYDSETNSVLVEGGTRAVVIYK